MSTRSRFLRPHGRGHAIPESVDGHGRLARGLGIATYRHAGGLTGDFGAKHKTKIRVTFVVEPPAVPIVILEYAA
jgi:hypothetical protein